MKIGSSRECKFVKAKQQQRINTKQMLEIFVFVYNNNNNKK